MAIITINSSSKILLRSFVKEAAVRFMVVYVTVEFSS